ncbi:uncharacterized protein [Onthophagus taurus]|uniref:uncharacterized protein n=1 Tax=Onthophagus taurus TaxID=166361 RepID=UPI0039BEC32D
MIKRKLYYDNEYNTCVCFEPRDCRRIPAEKPFEVFTKIKKNKDKKYHAKSTQHKREDNFDYRPITCSYKYVPCGEVDCKPKLMVNIDHVKNQKAVSSETTDNQSYQHPYPQKRTLNGQHPHVCIQPEYYEPCECGRIYKKCEDSKGSYTKRAWNAVKSTTKNIFGFKQKRPTYNEYIQSCANQFVYPYPVPFARYVPKKKHHHTKNHCNRTHNKCNRPSLNSSISEDIYSTKDTISDDPKVYSRFKETQTPENYKETAFRGYSPCHYAECSPEKDCCCVCDVDYCECKCCTEQHEVIDVHRNTQTSIQNIKERFTQTDFPKRCCKCCKCCAIKSKRYTTESIPANRGSYAGKCTICDKCVNVKGPCPRAEYFDEKSPKKEFKEAEQEKSTKTQMVKTNSIQCIPIVENKATSYDDPNLSRKMPEVMRDLWDGKYDLTCDKNKKNIGDVPIYKTTIDWTNDFLQSMTPRRKPKNFFIDDGLFSSPLSGKQYNLSTTQVNLSPRLPKKNLPKPLNLNDDIFKTNISKKLYHSYGEHNTLISAICDAILKKHDDDMCIGNSQFVCKDDLSSKQDLNLPTQEDTKKCQMNRKAITKSIVSKTKKPSKQSSSVENSTNTTKIGSIPISTNKKSFGKKIVNKKAEKNENSFSGKTPLKKMTNCDTFKNNSSKSHDLYQNPEYKHFSERTKTEKCENQIALNLKNPILI